LRCCALSPFTCFPFLTAQRIGCILLHHALRVVWPTLGSNITSDDQRPAHPVACCCCPF
jgi:hypothetical protein